MSRTLSKVWWLLALCGIAEAMHASINLLIISHPLTDQIFGSSVRARSDMGWLAVAAGFCAIATGIWNRGKGRSWLLSLQGLAIGAFGTAILKGPRSFRTISDSFVYVLFVYVLLAVMAASLGAFALGTAKTQQRSGSSGKRRWILFAVGVAFIGFAVSFIVIGGFLPGPEPHHFSPPETPSFSQTSALAGLKAKDRGSLVSSFGLDLDDRRIGYAGRGGGVSKPAALLNKITLGAAIQIWMSSYLALCAIFMMWLASRVYRGIRQPDQGHPFLPASSPSPTH